MKTRLTVVAEFWARYSRALQLRWRGILAAWSQEHHTTNLTQRCIEREKSRRAVASAPVRNSNRMQGLGRVSWEGGGTFQGGDWWEFHVQRLGGSYSVGWEGQGSAVRAVRIDCGWNLTVGGLWGRDLATHMAQGACSMGLCIYIN